MLLSTDDRFVSRAARGDGGPRIAVVNPERHALDMLRHELGADGLARFLRLHRSGPGDYSRDRGDGNVKRNPRIAAGLPYLCSTNSATAISFTDGISSRSRNACVARFSFFRRR